MYHETVDSIVTQAIKKVQYLHSNPLGYLTSAMLAGAYVGIGVLVAFIVGSQFYADHSPWMKIMMGGSFAIALSLVVIAGAELFTGNNMVLAIGWFAGKNSAIQMLAIWLLSWTGNLIGAIALATLLYFSTVLNGTAESTLVQAIAEKKMTLAPMTLFMRGILCNWLVCLAVWCCYRMKSETGKLLMIFWCLYAFVAAGFEHSVANMTLLTLALFQPHSSSMTLGGMGYNLLWVTMGNILGGALFVGGAYWVARHSAHDTKMEHPVLELESPNKVRRRVGVRPLTPLAKIWNSTMQL